MDVVSPHGIEKRPGPGHRDDVVYDGGEEWTRTGDKRQVQRAVSQLVPISIESLAEMVRQCGFLILHELDIKPIQYLDFERANELQQNENRPDDFVNARTGEIDEIKHEDRRENHNVDDRKQRSPHSRLSLPAFTADVQDIFQDERASHVQRERSTHEENVWSVVLLEIEVDLAEIQKGEKEIHDERDPHDKHKDYNQAGLPVIL